MPWVDPAAVTESELPDAVIRYDDHADALVDLRLPTRSGGPGLPRLVVLIHGIGASIYTWRSTLPPLVSAGYRVIAFDNRGFGFSDQPAHGYHNADYVRLVVALLDSLGVASAVLVGHSMGGTIAADVALAQPDRVRGMVLIDAAGYGIRWPGVLRIAVRAAPAEVSSTAMPARAIAGAGGSASAGGAPAPPAGVRVASSA